VSWGWIAREGEEEEIRNHFYCAARREKGAKKKGWPISKGAGLDRAEENFGGKVKSLLSCSPDVKAGEIETEEGTKKKASGGGQSELNFDESEHHWFNQQKEDGDW